MKLADGSVSFLAVISAENRNGDGGEPRRGTFTTYPKGDAILGQCSPMGKNSPDKISGLLYREGLIEQSPCGYWCSRRRTPCEASQQNPSGVILSTLCNRSMLEFSGVLSGICLGRSSVRRSSPAGRAFSFGCPERHRIPVGSWGWGTPEASKSEVPSTLGTMYTRSSPLCITVQKSTSVLFLSTFCEEMSTQVQAVFRIKSREERERAYLISWDLKGALW